MNISPHAVTDKEPPLPVLVADDETLIRQALTRALGLAGYDVYAAADGPSAIQIADEHKPALAVVDLSMPDMHGFEVIRQLKAQYGDSLHITVVSGDSHGDNRLRAFDEGADDFLAKPVSMPELLKRLRAARRMQTARIEAQKARDEAERLLVYASEAASLLAHDLNNGFAIAISNASYIRDTAALDEDQTDALGSTIRTLRRMSSLASNLIDVSRLEDGAMIARTQHIRMRELLDAVADVHAGAARAGGSTLRVHCDPDLRGWVDPALMERVLHNLVGNAVRYVTEQGSISLTARELRRNDGTECLRLTVSNTGPSIPKNISLTLFEKYRTGKDGKAMRGMGLYFCRLAVEAHRGTIALDHVFPGTSFVVDLPVFPKETSDHD